MAEFLFELGIEEVPVGYIENIQDSLLKAFKKGLKENLISYDKIESKSTNRRFTIYCRDISCKAQDRIEEIKGPSKKIAYDKEGKVNVPLLKFLESNNALESDLIERENKKGIYLAVVRDIVGEQTELILGSLIPQILKGLKFPKNMKWNDSGVSFVRPVSNLLALFDNKLIDFSFAGVKSSKFVYGHRLLTNSSIEVSSLDNYFEVLEKSFVIVDQDKRKEKIVNGINELEKSREAKALIDEGMLNYYVYNNEFPHVFIGSFQEEYLNLPKEIISAFMVNEKKLIPLINNTGELINFFIGVSNIEDVDSNVVLVNEQVSKATFEDAGFFWNDDKSKDFFKNRESLKNVLFHKDIGNYYEKTERLEVLMDKLISKLEIGDKEMYIKAAQHCKNDLVTMMVREFPSLQGIMGGLYLKEQKENRILYEAVYNHYEPKGFVGNKINNFSSALLSFVDKLDSVTAFIASDFKISGSKDPYGIRRDANGIVKIILDMEFNISVKDMINTSLDNLRKNGKVIRKDVENKCFDFMITRIETIFKENLDIRYDVVSAVCHDIELNIYKIFLRAMAVMQLIKENNIQVIVQMHTRIKNILSKNEDCDFNKELLKEDAEKSLYNAYLQVQQDLEKNLLDNDFNSYLKGLKGLQAYVERFFEEVMVMDKVEEIRKNRLAFLHILDNIFSVVANFSLINIS